MKITSFHFRILRLLACLASLALYPSPLRAASLTASDGAAGDYFGSSVSQSGGVSLVGANFDNTAPNIAQGSAYGFLNSATETETNTQSVKLTASDGATNDLFGSSVSLSGGTGLIGAAYDTIGNVYSQGSAYVFRDLDITTVVGLQSVKLTASQGVTYAAFGYSVSLSGSTGLVGAIHDAVGGFTDPFGFNYGGSAQGSAYLFRNLDTAAATVTEDVKLTASDGAVNDNFGSSVSLSGTTGLVGASNNNSRGMNSEGSAYVFHNLNTATGIITQNAKLTASDGRVNHFFGRAVSLSGSSGLVGASNATGSDINGDVYGQGSAYLFRNLDTVTGNITENVKLTASDGATGDYFGISVSLSGGTGLVGAFGDTIGASSEQGSAYVFRNLNIAAGTVTQNVKLTASDGALGDQFGNSVSLIGDQFLIGAPGKNSFTGKAYTGSVSSVTTLDTGNTSKTISGISFVSQDNWIVGRTTDANRVTLSAGDSANVVASGKVVIIGETAGSDNNALVVAGTVIANRIDIGSVAGNQGNTLELKNTAVLTASAIHLALANILLLQGDYSNFANLMARLGSTNLQVWDGANWITVNNAHHDALITQTFVAGNTTVTAVPEPSTWILLGFGGLVMFLAARKKKMAAAGAVLVALQTGHLFAAFGVINTQDRGWYNSSGNHDPDNDNYFISSEYHDWFLFDLTGITNIANAELRIFNPSNGYYSSGLSETIVLYAVSTSAAALTAGGSGLTGIYDDLGNGPTYGALMVTQASNGTIITINLNSQFISDANARGGVGTIAIGGAVTSGGGMFGYSYSSNPADGKTQLAITTVSQVPEPSTWMLFLMAGSGVVFLKGRSGRESRDF